MPRHTRRSSLSDWWARPEGEEDSPKTGFTPKLDIKEGGSDLEDEQCDSIRSGSPAKRRFSPTRRSPSFFNLADCDDSDIPSSECSPRKKVAVTHMAGNDHQEAGINTAMMTTLRGICAEYFENNISPILRYVQQTQEQLIAQMKEVTATLEHKANSEDVPTMLQIEEAAGKVVSKADDSKVAIQIRLEELANTVNQKVKAAEAKALSSTKGHAELESRVRTAEQKVSALPSVLQEQQELEARVRTAEQKVIALNAELKGLQEKDETGTQAQPGEITKMKAVFAAAGLRFDRQFKEVRQDMKKLREECLGQDVGDRWPGRKLETGSEKSMDSLSDNGSDKLSLGASATASSLSPDEKAELSKIRTIVASAGHIYSRELRELKKQLSEMRDELRIVKSVDKVR
jgi:DNA repair exonuclease SbcCD ATPase subunit